MNMSHKKANVKKDK